MEYFAIVHCAMFCQPIGDLHCDLHYKLDVFSKFKIVHPWDVFQLIITLVPWNMSCRPISKGSN